MSAARPEGAAGGHRALTVAALLATYMQAVNISLPNAALPYMQGSLSMADDEVGCIFSSYIAAGVAVLPMTPWLAQRFGRKAVYQVSLAVFALGLVLDVRATTSIEFVLARIVQGLAGGTIAPLSLAILLDVLPPVRHPRVNLTWTVLLLLGICTGPAIGGWLSEYYGWPSIFHVSLPVTAFVLLVVALSLPEKRPAQTLPFDFFGLGTASLGITGLQMLLDRGERLEWFASPEIWAEALAAALGFYFFAVHVLTAETHFVDKALLRDRNFVLSTIMYFALGFVLLPTLALTSPMLEELLRYPVDTAGYMTIPRGIALVGALVLMSFLPARLDNRPFVAGGTALVVYANWRMLGYSPTMDWWPVAAAGLVQGAGLGIMMPALARTAFVTLHPRFRPEGVAVFNLARLYGSTIGIAVVQIFFYDNTQAVHLALARHLTPHRAGLQGAASLSKQALAGLNELVTGQAAVIAVIDQFKILMIVMLVASPLVLFLRRQPPPTR
ncbi:MFS transporter, DHA2 family, multidrug resistance protein [Tistlia consotensis]|uniref:MFS transporter, DHA2 family, multidrug resistance protein n=1 Tax=Tistlia consotensis USBA 355 TaxID=560819 RepID=A0A1Y6BC93_9PROT|nr:MFS transporter [Tistlia consotensis]SMF03425.1 MFS transporter, DHA2 family, multidrug resistance protein [Tistlia consotensis USBA 355]SNR53690.1 MFS transporter, DHA2 family, multidrug resistance protein [Tistlia consotensis]